MLVGFAFFLFSLTGAVQELPNPGFEAKPTKREPLPGWTIDWGAQNGALKPESKFELDRKEKAKGKQSLHVFGDENTRRWRSFKLPLPVYIGGEYTLEAQVKTEGIRPNGFGLNNCYLGIFFFDAQENVAGRELVWPKQPDQDWTRMEVKCTAPPSARSAQVFVFLSMIGDLWIDELELSIDGGEKIADLERVSFEDFAKARKMPSKWKKEVGATSGDGSKNSRVEVDREAQALKITGTPDTAKWWIVGPELKAKPGELYRFSGLVKAEGVQREGNQFENLHLSLAFFDRKGQQIGDTRFGSAGHGTFDWKEVAVEAVSPQNTRSVRARVFLSMSGEAWFDDLEIARLEDVPLPYGDWISIETDKVTLRFSETHPKANEMKQYARRLDDAKDYICRELEVEFPEKITVMLYKDLAEGRLLTGGSLDFADPKGRKVHQQWNSYIGHEMVHVIAHTMLQYSGTGILGEGIAVWLNGQSAERHHRRAMELLKQGELPSIQAMLDDFRAQSQGYPASGSFCGFLIQTHGLETFKKIYPSEKPSEELAQLVGESFQDMEDDWHAELARYR